MEKRQQADKEERIASVAKPDWSHYASTRNLSRNRLLRVWHSELVDHFLRTFADVDITKRVLDIGPANGFFLVLLRELGFADLEGLEVSPVFLDILRSKGLRAELGDIVTGEGLENLSPPYDVVLLMEVLEHLEDPLRALKRVRNLLANHGFVYMTVPTSNCIFDRIRRVLYRTSREEQVKRIDETHRHAFTASDIRTLFLRCGFKAPTICRLSMRPPVFGKYFQYFPGRRSYLFLRAALPNAFRGLCLSALAQAAHLEQPLP